MYNWCLLFIELLVTNYILGNLYNSFFPFFVFFGLVFRHPHQACTQSFPGKSWEFKFKWHICIMLEFCNPRSFVLDSCLDPPPNEMVFFFGKMMENYFNFLSFTEKSTYETPREVAFVKHQSLSCCIVESLSHKHAQKLLGHIWLRLVFLPPKWGYNAKIFRATKKMTKIACGLSFTFFLVAFKRGFPSSFLLGIKKSLHENVLLCFQIWNAGTSFFKKPILTFAS